NCSALGGDMANRVTLRYDGANVAVSNVLTIVTNSWVNVDVVVRSNGAVKVWFNNVPVIDTTISGWTGVAGRKFVWAAVTGGESSEHNVEEVFIETFGGSAVSHDFSSQPAGSSLLGNASVSGGVGILTPNSGGQVGSIVLPVIDTGVAVKSFAARFAVRAWDGGGADGFSFNFGNLPTSGSAFGEGGWGGSAAGRDGLAVRFVTYSGSGGPKIEVVYSKGGTTQNVASFTLAAIRNHYYADVSIYVTASGKVAIGSTLGGDLGGDNTRDSNINVALQETQITNWSPDAGWTFGFGARTGGITDQHSIDNVLIDTVACGNGQFEAGESCDDGNTANGDCCSSTCTFESAATVCRAASGACDVAETCTGSSATCPADGVASSGTECRAASGVCDLAETCDGTTKACPTDAVKSSGTECRAAADVCDAAESCDGSAKTCPTDVFKASGTECRAASGACDVAESCTGTSTSCPTDSVATSGTTCRAASGTCDLAESCDGTTKACPADAFRSAGTECRAASDACDVAETCTGTTAACPSDAVKTSGTQCRAASGACDVAESCDGTAKACPSDAVATSGTECRASAGACDLAEACDGTTKACPTDALKTSGTECRAASGACDVAETCDGTTSACPTDAVKTAGTECRASAGDCDLAESCDGTAKACPTDAYKTSGTECHAASGVCDTAESCSGTSASCPTDAVKTSGTECRVAAGACDLAESCDGTAKACPTDALK
ncbi:MAG: hypothetical protein ACKOCT_06400, partial [Alphaproteobacteria bacterium]